MTSVRQKRIHVKFFPPDGTFHEKVFVAPPKKVYTEESLDDVIEKTINWLDEKFPKWNWRMVKVGTMRVNFIYDGLREETCPTSPQTLTRI